MPLVAVRDLERQPPPRDWTPERRAQAKANVDKFVLELATDPDLPDVPVRLLRVLYPLHLSPSFTADILRLAIKRRWTVNVTRRVVKALFQAQLLDRCRGQYVGCRVHGTVMEPPAIEHTMIDHTTGSVAALDA